MKPKTLVLLLYALVATTIITVTPSSLALVHDARPYYITAVNMVQQSNIVSSFFSSVPQFIDHGYPTFLATIMQFVGTDNIVALQIANYLLWLSASWIIYRSLLLVGAKHARWGALFMLFSPLYLTFSGKVYSEPLACLGSSLIIYSIVSMLKSPSLLGKIALTLGGIILFSTKSVLLPFIIPLGIYLFFKKEFKYLFFLMLIPIILAPSIVGSLGGGRSLYTLNIQSSKVEQSYDQVLSCVPYYLSYPLGKALLPQYEGVCHQNDASVDMPMYANNPYVLSDLSREVGFDYSDWLARLARNPFKYLLIMTVSLANIVFFEGIYPSIHLLMPVPIMYLSFVITKVALSSYLWLAVLRVGKKHLILLAPIIYFVLVVTHFPVEPRYFYPFIPYMYFLVGLDRNRLNKL